MMRTFKSVLLLLAAVCFSVQGGIVPHIGYAYPAGGRPGTTLQVSIGGQYLKDLVRVHVTGLQVEVQQVDYFRLYDRKEANRVRRFKETLEAKRDKADDELSLTQIERSLDKINEEMEMVRQMRTYDRKNPMMARRRQFNPQIAEQVTLNLTIPADAEPGDYDLRVITADGISNPLLFRVGVLDEFSEKESNNRVSEAEQLPELPVVINGQIFPGDVDCFSLNAREGQTLVFRTDARSLVPYLADAVPGWFQAVLTLYDSRGREVAFNDDYRFDPDPVLIYEVPESGQYTVSIHDSIYRGRKDFVYRLSVGELPFIAQIDPLGGSTNREVDVALRGVNLPVQSLSLNTGGEAPSIQYVTASAGGLTSNRRAFQVDALPDLFEAEPNNLLSQSQAVSGQVVVNGVIASPGDADCFRIEGKGGETRTFEVMARRLGSPLDARLVLLDAEEHMIELSDDVKDQRCGLITHHADARIDYTFPASGTCYLRLDDLQGKGGADYAYRLVISEPRPDFQLRVVPASVKVAKDSSAVITVHVVRSGGFDGAVELSIPNAPPGLGLQNAVIPEGADSAQIVLTASDAVEEGILELRLEGSARFGLQTVHRRALPAEDMMQAFIYRHLVPAHQFLVQVTEPDPVTLSIGRSEDGPVKVRPGQVIDLHARLVRRPGVRGGVRLTLSDPPEWLTLESKQFGRPVGSIRMNVSANAEPGSKTTVVLNGSIRVPKTKDDPDYNPVIRFLNFEEYNFAVDAIPIEVVD